MNIIITDCTGEKNLSLQFAARKIFAHRYKIITTEGKEEVDTPLSFSDLEKRANDKLLHIAESFDISKYEKDNIFYAVLKKGFVKSNNSWMIAAYSLFRKRMSIQAFPTIDLVTIPPRLWPLISLDQDFRYQKMYEFYPKLQKEISLVELSTGIKEDEWFKRVFMSSMKSYILSS